MKNKLIEESINEVLNASNYSEEFKRAFKQFIVNNFEGNSSTDDLKVALNFLEDSIKESEI